MNQDVKQHYRMLYQQHGRSHTAVQYSSRSSQQRRFDILLEIADQADSILDIGCGLGDILPQVRERFGPQCHYTGVDFVEEFIADAQSFFSQDPHAAFKVQDIVAQPVEGKVDYAVLSGIFNNKMDDNWGFIQTVLKRMWQCSTKGIAFNALSTYVDYQDEGLHYQDPLVLFDFCKKQLSPYVTLRHDYDVKENSIPFEYTIWVHR